MELTRFEKLKPILLDKNVPFDKIEEIKKIESLPLKRGKDYLGKEFNKLILLEKAPSKITPSGRTITHWWCICTCENFTIKMIGLEGIKRGKIQSCGCVHDSRSRELGKSGMLDISNKQFGNLIALYPTEKRCGSHVVWHCKCILCNRETDVSSTNLKTGNTSSCNCQNLSKGALKIINILESNNIYFEMEKTFEDCKFQDTHRLARFDFYVENKYLIEFDGIQHFSSKGVGFGANDLENIQKRDNYKNKWCKEHNISLIRIPYMHLEELNLNDLLLETSNFIVKE